ncbi:molybdopterin-dependent oxidoreductase [Chloroflexota bacterium]
MQTNKALCKKCGRPFISNKALKHISKIAGDRNLARILDSFLLCQDCKIKSFAHTLVGVNLERVTGNPYVAKRRSEKIEPIKVDPRTGAKVYKSECFICNSGCDAKVWVKDGEVIRVEGDSSSPVTKGVLCAKGLASKSMLYHPDRLTHPIKRVGERGEGKWQRISWDEALNTMATRFKEIEEGYGKDAIHLSQGTSRGWWHYFARFANAWGKQVSGPGVAQCGYPRHTSGRLDTGSFAMECPDYERTKCMIVWAANPPATWPVKAMGMMEAKGRGAKLIVIDPVLSETASKADIWLRLRPSTDVALALGMINVTINEGLYEKEFVEKWCLGFDELTERVQEYPPEKVEEITWVPRAKIIEAAKLYATTKPACITQCLAIDQNQDTISTSRAIGMLASITGNFDVPGGNVIPMPLPVYGHLDNESSLADHLTEEQHERRLGSSEYPLLSGEACLLSPHAHNFLLWQAILTGKPYPVRAMYCHGDNMVIAYPNTKMVTKALMSLDFFVVADLFLTPTAKLADIVLPAATWMERNAPMVSHQVSANVIHLQQKTVEIGECWSDYKILNELAKRLGFGELMFETEESYCDDMLKLSGVTWEEFKKKGIISVPYTYRKYEKDGFKTPSRKIELYSQRLKGLGFDPLPSYREPTESPISNPQLAKEYPLILTTGAREPVLRHSELRNIPALRQICPEIRVKINPKTAEGLSIKEGDTLVVETQRGSMEAKAWLREDIDPRVVQVPSHWPGKNNVNLVTDDENCAPMIGSAQLRCQLCKVKRGE